MYENFNTAGNASAAKIACNKLIEYFDNTRVSVGSLCRKLNYFLMDLVNNTGIPWKLTIEYHPDNQVYTAFLVGLSTDPPYVSFDIFSKNLKNAMYNKNIVSDLFQKDKYIKYPVTSAKFLFSTTKGKFIFDKRVSAENVWVFECKQQSGCGAFIQRLLVKLWYARKLTVLSCKVLDSTEEEITSRHFLHSGAKGV